MPRFVIGTAGHVDHGKTTLVHALTGVMTDRLPEERRRGMSIELGFAPLVAGGVAASIVDVPGHRRFVPTMIAGASGIALVVLVVAADEGVMPQTREHVAVCELCGVRRAVVALTKTDRVDDETRAMAEEDVRALLGERLDAEIVPCAPIRGEGVAAVRAAIARALDGLPAPPADAPPRLWVDRVLHVRGTGTVLTGTLVQGRIARGDRLCIAGVRGPVPFVVRDLHVHAERVPHAEASTRLAVAAGVDASVVARGDLVTCEDAAPAPTSCVDVVVRGAAVRRGSEVMLHVGTSAVAAEITRAEPLEAGEVLARLVLAEPRPIGGGDRHLVRGGGVLAGGLVLDASPDRRGRGVARRALATAVGRGDATAAVELLLDREAPRPFDPRGPRLAIAASSLEEAAARGVRRGALVRCGPGVIRRSTVAALADRARRLVLAHAEGAPLDRGMPLAALRSALSRDAGEDAAELAILAARARRGPDDVDAVAVDGDVVLPAVRAGTIPRELAAHVGEARGLLASAGGQGLSQGRVAEVTGMPPARARAVLAVLEREGAAVRAGELWFPRALVERVVARVAAHLATGASLSVVEAKTLLGLPRRQAILLLEHLDGIGITRRSGDARVLARSAS